MSRTEAGPGCGQGTAWQRPSFAGPASLTGPAPFGAGSFAGQDGLARIVEVLAPAQPVLDPALFAPRDGVLDQLASAMEEGSHVFIHGPHGSGKTSLARALLAQAVQAGHVGVYVPCSRTSTLDAIARTALARISRRFDRAFDPKLDGAGPRATLADALPAGPATAHAVSEILSRVVGPQLVVVLDEFDRPEEARFTQEVAELVKIASDQALPVRFILVGAVEGAGALLQEHPSLARVVYALRLGPMTDGEIATMLGLAGQAAGLEIPDEVSSAIAGLAAGSPYAARLMALKAAKHAVRRGSGTVDEGDFERGLGEIASYLQTAGLGELDRLMDSSASLPRVLQAVVEASRANPGGFSAADVAGRLQGEEVSGHPPGIEPVLVALAEDGRILKVANAGTEKRFRIDDPRLELALAIVSQAKPAAR